MNNQEIISFSISELREKNPDAPGIVHNGCFISLPEYDNQNRSVLFNYPCRINAYFIMICESGSADININLNEYRISENSILIHKPNNILQMIGTNEARGYLLGFEENLLQQVDINVRGLGPVLLQVLEEPVLHVTPEESRQLQGLIRSIADEIAKARGMPFFEEILRSYFSLFLYKLCSIVSKDRKERPSVESSAKSRNEEYFHRFMQELSLHYKNERSVGFYASQLCITPKYLTTLIKKVSGHSAADWIDRYVILEAKNLLRYSSMSIQEVAYYLNFPNQSFFGKYFKHQTGMSPSAYKMQQRSDEA